ncbi:MAG: hypothetical protein Q4B63_11290 [Clostridium perfringens]|nr:hypothetical protein [Clostridium perfringens]
MEEQRKTINLIYINFNNCEEYYTYQTIVQSEIEKFIDYLGSKNIEESLDTIKIVANKEELDTLLSQDEVNHSGDCYGTYSNDDLKNKVKNCIHCVVKVFKSNENKELEMITIFHEIVHASISYLDRMDIPDNIRLFFNEYLAIYISYSYALKKCFDKRESALNNYLNNIRNTIGRNNSNNWEYAQATDLALIRVLEDYNYITKDDIAYIYITNGLHMLCKQFNTVNYSKTDIDNFIVKYEQVMAL